MSVGFSKHRSGAIGPPGGVRGKTPSRADLLRSSQRVTVPVAAPNTQLETLLTAHAEYLRACRHRLAARLESRAETRRLAAYVCGGKMLRPLILYLFSHAVGGKVQALESGGEAIELMHAASLVHDDILDGSSQRRGLPALHLAIGARSALVMGDYLILLAFDALCDSTVETSADQALEAIRTLSRCAQECCLGQVDELGDVSSASVRGTYVSIAARKTGAPFAAAAALGVILAGGTREQVEGALSYGRSLGILYQMTDDALDNTARSISHQNGGAHVPTAGAKLVEVERGMEIHATQAARSLECFAPSEHKLALIRFAAPSTLLGGT